MSKLPPILAVATLAAAAAAVSVAIACSRTLAPEAPAPLIERVVLVSVDGLRADALEHMPALSTVLESAVWTREMQTVTPSLTVPGHLAMLTGRDVTVLGIRSNTLDAEAAVILAANGASTIFKWVRASGGTSIALAAFSLVPPSDAEAARAFFEVDSLVPTGAAVAPIVDRAIEVATRQAPPSILFVHLPTLDFAGHDHGWTLAPGESGEDVLTPEYRAAVAEADAHIERLRLALAGDIAAGRAALVITADHGGGHGDGCVAGVPPEREHCTAHPGDRTIPFVLVASALTPRRLDAGSSITQIAPTIARLLAIPTPRDAGVPLID